MGKFIIESNSNLFTKLIMSSIISSTILGIVGLIMLFLPNLTNRLIGLIIGVLFLISGANTIYKYFKRDGAKLYSYNLIFGIVLATLGVIVILLPFSIAQFITACLGLYFITTGGNKIAYGVWLKIGNDMSWLFTVVVGATLILFGILLITNPFSSIALTKLVGIFLILGAVLDITDVVLLKKRNKEISKIFW